MLGKLGRLVTANPWKVVFAWVIAVAVIVPFSPTLAEVSNTDQTSFLPAGKESIRAQQLAEEAFPPPPVRTASSSSRARMTPSSIPTTAST